MTPDELDACYHDTAGPLADFHRETGVAFSFRVREWEDRETSEPPNWVIEIRFGSPELLIEVLDADAWRATRGTPAWRDLVLASCDNARGLAVSEVSR